MKLTNFKVLCISFILFGLCFIQSMGRVNIENDLRNRISILEMQNVDLKHVILMNIYNNIMPSCLVGQKTR